jgi:oxidoreductase
MESNNNNSKNLKALIIGATGASGRELVDLLLASKYYYNISVIVRRKIDRWENLDENMKKKLKILRCDDLSILCKSKEEIVSFFQNEFPVDVDTVFCCLGSRVNRGDDEFKKVDFDFVTNSANLCEYFNIPHFSLISSQGADSSSWFLYLRTKGLADQECLKKNIRYISIFRPGFIQDRDNDSRIGEKIASVIPFIDKIKSVDLAKALICDDINFHFNTITDTKKIFTHKEIKNLKCNLL